MPKVELRAVFGVMVAGCLLALYMGTAGNLPLEAAPPVTPIACTNSVVVSGASAATAELVPLVSGKRVYVCGFVFTGGGNSTAALKYGTGSNCGSGTTSLTGALELGDNTSVAFGSGAGYVTKTALSNALCWTNGQAIQVSGVVTYAQF